MKFLSLVLDPGMHYFQKYVESQLQISEDTLYMLYTEGLITKKEIAQVEKKGFHLIDEPLKTLSDNIANDKEKLIAFANILLISKTPRESQDFALELLRDYGKRQCVCSMERNKETPFRLFYTRT